MDAATHCIRPEVPCRIILTHMIFFRRLMLLLYMLDEKTLSDAAMADVVLNSSTMTQYSYQEINAEK